MSDTTTLTPLHDLTPPSAVVTGGVLALPSNLRTGTLQGAVGTFSAIIGAQMLIVPHQFSAQTYDALRPHLALLGTVTLLVGLAMLLVSAMRTAAGVPAWRMLALD